MRPLAAARPAAPVVDLRVSNGRRTAPAARAWDEALVDLHRLASGDRDVRVEVAPIKRFDRRRGADQAELEAVLAALDEGHAVTFYGWWPSALAASTTDILGVDTIDVLPPDRKGGGLLLGHGVVIVGYGRHAAFPGGGYVIVRNDWPGWGDDGDGYLPFTHLRAYAVELCRLAPRTGPTSGPDGPDGHRPAGRHHGSDGQRGSGAGRPGTGVAIPGPAAAPGPPTVGRGGTDATIRRQARCRDERGSLTHLFFSDDLIDLARAKAICSTCGARRSCLAGALERSEAYGIWGGQLVIDGRISDKRPIGRPPRNAGGALVVDEITGVPIVA